MSDWSIDKCTEREKVFAILNTDRIWSGYAICDLESPLWERSAFYLIRNSDKDALILHFDAKFFQVLTAFGDPEGVNTAWHRIPLPEKAWISLRTKAEMENIRQFYQVGNLHHMWRLHFSCSSNALPDIDHTVIPLSSRNRREIEALLKEQPENAYSPDQLQRGVFFGVENEGRLVSLVGTHVVSAEYRLAAVGNAYTLPEYRRRGYFRACLSAVLKRLLEMGIDDVVANVGQENNPSLRGALSLGFLKHCHYWEGIGVKR